MKSSFEFENHTYSAEILPHCQVELRVDEQFACRLPYKKDGYEVEFIVSPVHINMEETNLAKLEEVCDQLYDVVYESVMKL